MTLVKSKTKVPAAKRKMSAGHHRQNQRYLKTYWPYIPIFTVLGGSLVVNQYLPTSFNNSQLGYASSRFAYLTGLQSNFLLGLISFGLVVLVIYYLVRHVKRLKKLLIDGEKYLKKHYSIDIGLALIIAGLYILVR